MSISKRNIFIVCLLFIMVGLFSGTRVSINNDTIAYADDPLYLICDNLETIYNGSAQPISPTFNNLDPLPSLNGIYYDGEVTVPIDAGVYSVFVFAYTNGTYYTETFTYTIDKIQLEVDAPVIDSLTKVYDGNINAAVSDDKDETLSRVLTGEDVTLDAFNTASYNSKDVATASDISVAYTISGDDIANYYVPVEYSVSSATITCKQLTISGTIADTSREYDASTDVEITEIGTLDGVVGAESVGVSAVAIYNSKDVATASEIIVSYSLGTLGDEANYTAPVDSAPIAGTITKVQLTITELATVQATKMYDSTTDATVTTPATIGGIIGLESVQVINTATYNSKDVATASEIIVSYSLGTLGDEANYFAPVDSAAIAGTITKVQLTITEFATVQTTKIYDSTTDATVTTPATIGGIIGLESVQVINTATYNSKDVATASEIIVSYSLGTLGDEANYITPVDSAPIAGTITKVQLTITELATIEITKEYDSTTNAIITTPATIGGIVGSESVEVINTATYNSKDVATASEIIVSYSLGTSGDESNYTAPVDSAPIAGTINRVQLTIDVNPTVQTTKEYNNNTDATITIEATIGGIVGSESVGVDAIATYDSKGVLTASEIIVSYSLGTLGDEANYIAPVNSAPIAATITAKQLTIADPRVVSKVYDGNVEATGLVTIGLLGGVFPENIVNVAIDTAVFNSELVLAVDNYIIITYIITGADSSNYIAPILSNKACSINAKQLHIDSGDLTSIGSTTKIYDGTVAFSGTVDLGSINPADIIGDDDVALDIVSVLYGNKNVGTTKNITVTYSLIGDDISNYIVPVANVFTTGGITKKQLAVNDPNFDITKTFDNTTNVLSVSANLIAGGVITGDVVTINAVGVYDNKNAGTEIGITITYSLIGTDSGNYTKPVGYRYENGIIEALEVDFEFDNLTHTYDGEAKTATFSIIDENESIHGTLASSLVIVISGEAIDAGEYTVSIDLSAFNNFFTSSSDLLVIESAISNITIGNMSKTYDGLELVITPVITNEDEVVLTAEICVEFSYERYSDSNTSDWKLFNLADPEAVVYIWEAWTPSIGGQVAPIDAGVYKISATVAEGENYQSSSTIFYAKVTRAQLTYTIDEENDTFGESDGIDFTINNGVPELVSEVTVTYTGYDITYSSSVTIPTLAGVYSVIILIDTNNYYGLQNSFYTIDPRVIVADNILIESLDPGISGDMISGFEVDYNNTIPAYTINDSFSADFVGITVDGIELTVTFKQGDIIIPGGITDAGDYNIVASIENPNITGTVSVSFIIHKIAATLNIPNSIINSSYTGAPVSVTGHTANPLSEELLVEYAYLEDGSSYSYTPPTAIGSYGLKIFVTDVNYYAEDTSVTLNITQAVSTLELEFNYSREYSQTGYTLTELVTIISPVVDQDFILLFQLEGESEYSDVQPINVGIYYIKAVFVNDLSFVTPESTNTCRYVIIKSDPTLTILDESTRKTFDGQTFSLITEISPNIDGITMNYRYYDSIYNSGTATYSRLETELENAPIQVGVYYAQAYMLDGGDNYNGAESGYTLVIIDSGEATVIVHATTLPYNGLRLEPVIETSPQGLNYTCSYTKAGISTDPINPGVYLVVVEIDDFSYSGSAFGELTIVKASLSQYMILSGPDNTTYDKGSKVYSLNEVSPIIKSIITLDDILNETEIITVVDTLGNSESADDIILVEDTDYVIDIDRIIIYKAYEELIILKDDIELETNEYETELPTSLGIELRYIHYADPDGTLDTSSQWTASAPVNSSEYRVRATITHPLYSGEVSVIMTILKAPLTIAAENTIAAYGGENVVSLISNYLPGDSRLNSLSVTPKIRIINTSKGVNVLGFTKAVTVGEYTVVPEGAVSNNYEITYVSATLTMSKGTLTVSALPQIVAFGDSINTRLEYTGYAYDDNVNSVFTERAPSLFLKDGNNYIIDLPTVPGVYEIIPQSGLAHNYNLVYVSATLILQRGSIESENDEIILAGNFHPDAVPTIGVIETNSAIETLAKEAVRNLSGLHTYAGAYDLEVTLNGSVLTSKTEGEYSMLIPENLRGKNFELLLIDDTGNAILQSYTIEGNYVIGNMNSAGATLVYAKVIPVNLFLMIIGGILVLIGGYFLFGKLKELKTQNDTIIANSNSIDPTIVAPTDTTEDEDAAFDAYLDELIVEQVQFREEKEEEDLKAVDEMLKNVKEEEYSKAELERLREKALQAKKQSVEDRITEDIEKRLIEEIETNREEKKEVYSMHIDRYDSVDEDKMTEEYIIENSLFPASQVITHEEAKAIYPTRAMRIDSEGNVFMEACFESRLNQSPDRDKYIYSELKNLILSYLGMDSIIFRSGEAYKVSSARIIMKFVKAGLCIQLNLDKQFIPEEALYTDRSAQPKYKEVPIEVVVNDGKQLDFSKKMIIALMISAGVEKDPDAHHFNYLASYPYIENANLEV